jgi:ribosomal protein S27AE
MEENMEEDNAEQAVEENKACIFPKCSKCGKGYLLPFSYKEDVFEKWKCSECAYIIEKR